MERRKKLIAQAHLAAKQAGCVDADDRRAVQLAVTGKASCADMTVAELVKLIDHWGGRGSDVRASTPECAQAPGMVTRWQLATIERLSWDMGWMDGLEDARLLAFLKRTAQVDRAEWLTRRDASGVITGLSRWKRQRNRRAAA
jgi:hypothetical protein